jgi:hypothetical protein
MLSPNVVEISEDIAVAFSQFFTVKSFSYSAGEIVGSYAGYAGKLNSRSSEPPRPQR